MPNSSHVSRSCQFAPRQTRERVGQWGSSASHRTFNRTWWLCRLEYRCVTTSNPPPLGRKSTPLRKSKKSKDRSGSSRRNRAISWYRSGFTVTTAWPNASWVSRMSSPNWARSRSAISGGDRGRRELATPLLPDVFLADLLLQLDDAVQQRLGTGRASGDVDVHGNDLVDALGHRVGVPVRSAAVGARAERDDVFGVGDLVVYPLEGRGHLVGHRPGHHQEVGLPGAVGEGDDAQTDEVVLGGRSGDQLDGAARQAEVHDPQRVPAAPVQDELDRLGHVDLIHQPHQALLVEITSTPAPS